MKILIMGLPGAGKTWLADWMQNELECAWYNADYVRKMANDWDFSDSGRERQAMRMACLAQFESDHGRTVICDFVCPTPESLNIFNADVVIWVDTIEKGRYADTNAVFQPPTEYDYRITEQMSLKDAKKWIEQFIDEKLAA
jgi:adenylylsulfate kinase